jgi:predicted neuraminidase
MLSEAPMPPFFQSQAIFRPGLPGTMHCHASTIAETAGGAFLAAWFGGTHEGHPDVSIWLARCTAGTWAPPVRVARVAGVPLWNPVLFRDAHDTLWLWYKVGPTIAAWTGVYMQSRDDGRTWSAPTYLPAGLLGPAKNKPITLSNGDILCGTSAETWSSWSCWVEISADGGKTWSKHGPIALSSALPGAADVTPEPSSAVWDSASNQLVLPHNFAGVIQPTVWEHAPGRLKMFMRSTRQVGRVCEASSDDMGRTWSPARPTDLLNPNSGLDGLRLADGRIVLAYNPSESTRSPLATALSRDNGRTWYARRLLETEPGEFSYPSIIQARDGRLHMTYTCWRTHIQHVAMSPEWIESA